MIGTHPKYEERGYCRQTYARASFLFATRSQTKQVITMFIVPHFPVDAKDLAVQAQIYKEIEQQGYSLRQLPTESNKQDFANFLATIDLGRIVLHPHSDDSGFVPIRFNPELDYINTTHLATGMHTDGSFSKEKIGIVVMYCEQSIKGQGSTKIIQFRKVLQHLNRLNSQEVPYLSEPTTLAVNRKGQRACGSILSQNPDGRLAVRYRGDTGDHTAQIDVHPKAQRIVSQLRDFVEDEVNQFIFTLKPGQILLLDNTSVLHGRTAFNPTKPRVLYRCWFGRWEKKWKS